jgi:hypothetical protein
MARVAYAEAGNQGDSGLAGVVYTVINRLIDGRWGDTVEAVVSAHHQFEPVMKAGGSWRGLPQVTPAQEARINTIVNLALDGRLPDLTGGARFFQNAKIVAARAAAGTVSPKLVHFGGAAPSAKIGDHTFYASTNGGSVEGAAKGRGGRAFAPKPQSLFIGENRAAMTIPDPLAASAAKGEQGQAPSSRQGLFVLADGSVRSEARP